MPSGSLRRRYYLLDDDEAPPGPLDEDAEPPLVPVLLEDELSLLIEPDEDIPPPLPELLVPPVALELPLSDEAELEGELGVVLADEDDEPPGTTTVSFSFVTDEVGPGLAPGTTVVVDSFSQPARARAPTSTNR